ncbi:MAG TPA: hypothetical protein VIH76_09390 [Candidatus Acidoferrales bacterium]
MRLSRWLLIFAIGSLFAAALACILFSAFSNAPFRKIIGPSFVLGGVMLLHGPLVYWALRYSLSHGNDKRPFVLVVGENLVVLIVVGIHYAVVLGILRSRDSFAVTIFAVAIPILAIVRILLSRRICAAISFR